MKLREIHNDIKTAIWNTNPDYDLVIDRLHLYYNMQIVTVGIDKDKNLLMQFPVFIQPYTQQPLILYQLETVPNSIIDQNTQAQSCTHLQVNKPYIALNSEIYISIRQQELRTCKRIGYVFYYEELFVVKHKSRHSCESTILLYKVLPINWYIGNITIKCHSGSMGDNRDPTGVLHQEISSLPVSIASDTRCF